ncbi:MAG: NAD-dependent epimerase/dehydratase family protein [Porticoccus sp.]
MKVLFAGCGDIGVRTIRALSDNSIYDHWQTLAMRRKPSALPSDIEAIQGDLCDSENFLSILDNSNVDVIVVTLTPDSMSDQGYLDSYVNGANVLKSTIKKLSYRPQLIIWVSSTGVYGQSCGEWVDESSVASSKSYRGKRLLEAENLVKSISKELVTNNSTLIKSVVVRFSGIYGPGRGRLLNQIKKGNIASKHPVSWTNRIHVVDCAGIIIHIIDLYSQKKDISNLYIGTDNQPVPAYEIQSWLANHMRVKIEENNEIPKNIDNKNVNRRCNNKLIKDSGYNFIFPDFKKGYTPLLLENNSTFKLP